MRSPLSLTELLSRARRRELTYIALNKTALAGAVLMVGAIVLLLAGSQILDWYWLVLLALASLGVALYGLRGSIPTPYAVAQRIDRSLKLADALSTAFYFSEHPERDKELICELQRRNAEETARRVDLRTAIPFRRPRHLALTGALAAAALGLFTVRYLVIGSLDLKPSLIKIAYDSFFSTKSYQANNERPRRANLDPRAGAVPNDPSLQANVPPDDISKGGNTPEADSQSGSDSKPGDQETSPDNSKQSSDSSQSANDQSGDQSASNNASDSANQQAGNSQKGDQPNGNNGSKSASDQKSSLMDKLRDALANMVDKMKSSSEGEKSAQQNPQKGQPGDRPGEKAQQSQDRQQQSSPSADQQGQEGDQKQSTDADNSEKASDKSPTQDAKNGIGSQDGEKAVREAEEAQAMGKISEILGKRAANVSGEFMVEVGDTKQQLKTPWTQQQANHTEAGSEIHRDEVPLADQQFVEQYFEEIRKNEPASASTRTKTAPKAPAKH